ncbi:hypothetical protein [Duganella sp. HH105]|uniref:hypothetical protein n=1 Tax=Duganella sp. HH105 TaxID=1781067 RepID=UPI000A06C8B2|nr:hypothetical protein [Duganella sp. HH105]
MTRETDEDAFEHGLSKLLTRFDRSLDNDAPGPYAGEDAGQPNEHTTRVHFLDEFAELLGWRLGLDGNMAEEARLRNDTVTRMDYLGVASESNTPVLLIEAKAWGKPFITPRARGTNTSYEFATLIAQTIDHWRNGGDRMASPAVAEWHDYIEQVGGYICGLQDAYEHEIPRAVVTSGQWLVVFKRPVATFRNEPPSANDIEVFRKVDFVARARELYSLLSVTTLCAELPFRIRATQVLNYVTPGAIVDCFHALHLSYEASGSQLFSLRPRILIYPAIVLRRDDDALLTVIESAEPLELTYRRGIEDLNQALEPHLVEVASAAEALLRRVNEQLGRDVPTSSLDEFPGYPISAGTDGIKRKSLVRRHPTALDHWVLITGKATHFLKAAPEIACRFHRWKECHAEGEAGDTGAVSMPRTGRPRSFFIDEQPHHCAHQGIQDRRETRCQIPLIDERICCKSCLFATVCWTSAQRPPLPCGR